MILFLVLFASHFVIGRPLRLIQVQEKKKRIRNGYVSTIYYISVWKIEHRHTRIRYNNLYHPTFAHFHRLASRYVPKQHRSPLVELPVVRISVPRDTCDRVAAVRHQPLHSYTLSAVGGGQANIVCHAGPCRSSLRVVVLDQIDDSDARQFLVSVRRVRRLELAGHGYVGYGLVFPSQLARI